MGLKKISSMMTTNITDEYGGPFSMNTLSPSDRNGVDNIVKARKPGFRGTITATVNGAPKRLKIAINAKDRFRPAGTTLKPGMKVSTMPKLAATKKQKGAILGANKAKGLLYKETEKEPLVKKAGTGSVVFKSIVKKRKKIGNSKSYGEQMNSKPSGISDGAKILFGLGAAGTAAAGLSVAS